MINVSRYPSSLLHRLRIDPDKENYEIRFEHEHDFCDFLQCSYYESGFILIRLIMSIDDQMTRSVRLSDVATSTLLDKFNLGSSSDSECVLTLRIKADIAKDLDFDWSSFMRDVNSLYAANDEYDITDYMHDTGFKHLGPTQLTVEIEVENEDQTIVITQDDAEELLDFSNFGFMTSDVLNNPEWLFNQNQLFEPSSRLETFKLVHIDEQK